MTSLNEKSSTVDPKGFPPRNALTALLVVQGGLAKRSLARAYRRSSTRSRSA